MAEQTVCDNCESGPLRAATGFYQVNVRKVLKDKDGSRTHSETEYDLCGACMDAIREAVKVIE